MKFLEHFFVIVLSNWWNLLREFKNALTNIIFRQEVFKIRQEVFILFRPLPTSSCLSRCGRIHDSGVLLLSYYNPLFGSSDEFLPGMSCSVFITSFFLHFCFGEAFIKSSHKSLYTNAPSLFFLFFWIFSEIMYIFASEFSTFI